MKTNILSNVKNWYVGQYPTDKDAKKYLNEKTTFCTILFHLQNGLDVYKALGFEDSLVRERVFSKLAEITDTSYDTIYYLWLHGEK